MARLRSSDRGVERYGQSRQDKGTEPQESAERERPFDKGDSSNVRLDGDFTDNAT